MLHVENIHAKVKKSSVLESILVCIEMKPRTELEDDKRSFSFAIIKDFQVTTMLKLKGVRCAPETSLTMRILDSFFKHSFCAVANGSEQKLAKTIFSRVFLLLANIFTRFCFVIAVVFAYFVYSRQGCLANS